MTSPKVANIIDIPTVDQELTHWGKRFMGAVLAGAFDAVEYCELKLMCINIYSQHTNTWPLRVCITACHHFRPDLTTAIRCNPSFVNQCWVDVCMAVAQSLVDKVNSKDLQLVNEKLPARVALHVV